MKKIISLMLVLCLMLSFTGGAFAATWTPGVDKTEIKAGDEVTVTITQTDAMADVTGVAYELHFNGNLFEYKEGSFADKTGIGFLVSNLCGDENDRYYKISYINTASQAINIAAGDICTLIFTAKTDISSQTSAEFKLLLDAVIGSNWQPQDGHAAGAAASVTVSPEASEPLPETGYYVTIGENQSISANEQVNLNVVVDSQEFETFNAYNIAVDYDETILKYTGEVSGVVDNEDGTLTIIGCGNDIDCGTGFTLGFTAIGLGTAKVEITAANVDISSKANTQDAPEATIYTETASVTVGGYTVTLHDDLVGQGTVAPDSDYTFTLLYPLYDYEISATMGDEPVEVTANDDGTYTISNVNGNLEINAEKGNPKSFDVEFTGLGAEHVTDAPEKATYTEDYEFTITAVEGYTFDVSAKVGDGDEFEPTRDGDTYTIPGASITGKLTISIDMNEIPSTTTAINFSGEGSADVVDGTSQAATNGVDFKFSLNKAEGYDYTVTFNGNELSADANGFYTIPGSQINGTALTVVVSKTRSEEAAIQVEVSEYITIDEGAIWLVTATGAAEDKVLSYGDDVMYWSDKYNAYAWLVFYGQVEKASVLAAAEEAVVEVSAAKRSVAYDMDINNTGVVDINDAQLVHNMYNAMYSSFGSVPVGRFLNADVVGDDRVVDTKDSAAIVNSILES